MIDVYIYKQSQQHLYKFTSQRSISQSKQSIKNNQKQLIYDSNDNKQVNIAKNQNYVYYEKNDNNDDYQKDNN